MGSWGKCDFSQLKKLEKQIEALKKEKEEFISRCVEEAAKLLVFIARERTPDEYGVKQDWEAEAVRKAGDSYEVTVRNQNEKASSLEYGYRTEDGGWVKGHFILAKSEEAAGEKLPELLKIRMSQYLGRCLDV